MKQGILTLLLTSKPTSIRRLSDVSTHLLSSRSRKEGPRRPVAGSHWLMCEDPTNNTMPPLTRLFVSWAKHLFISTATRREFPRLLFSIPLQQTIAAQGKNILGTQWPVSQGRDLQCFPEQACVFQNSKNTLSFDYRIHFESII